MADRKEENALWERQIEYLNEYEKNRVEFINLSTQINKRIISAIEEAKNTQGSSLTQEEMVRIRNRFYTEYKKEKKKIEVDYMNLCERYSDTKIEPRRILL